MTKNLELNYCLSFLSINILGLTPSSHHENKKNLGNNFFLLNPKNMTEVDIFTRTNITSQHKLT